MTPADAIKAVRDVLAKCQDLGLHGNHRAASLAAVCLKHLPAILDAAEQSEQRRVRAEAFERIRALDGKMYIRGFAAWDDVRRIIDEVEAAEKSGEL